MAVDYANTELQLAKALRASRRLRAVWEQFRLDSNSAFVKREFDSVFSSSVDEEGLAKAFLKETSQNAIASGLRNSHATLISAVQNSTKGFFRVLAGELSITAADVAAGPIIYEYTTTTLGKVSIAGRRGYLGSLYRAMTADSKSVLKNTVSLGTMVAAAGNTGDMTATTKTGLEHTLPGNVILVCTSQALPRPIFSTELELTTPLINGDILIPGDNNLTMGQSYEDGWTGATLQMDFKTVVDANDTHNAFSAHTLSALADGDFDETTRLLYVTVTRRASDTWEIRVYSDSDRTVLIFDSEVAGGGASPVGTTGTSNHSYTLNQGTGASTVWAFTFNKANANTGLPSIGNSDNLEVDGDFPETDDRFEIPATNDEAGLCATKIARIPRWRIALPSSATPTFTDANFASVSMS